MILKRYGFVNVLTGLALLFFLAAQAAADPIVVDHTCVKIDKIPESAIINAKQVLHIAYGHTSHGSQIISGMRDLVTFMNGLNYPIDLFTFNAGGSNGALDLRDTPFSGANDLGNPNRTQWASATRDYLQGHPEVNVIIWSWCGQVNGSQQEIRQYLELMSDLEEEFPKVAFVYMTGHLDGSGANGNVNLRNQQIRDFCIENDKILYDFADIESYDPDGKINYMELNANDACDYSSAGTTSRNRNWASEWQDSHTQGVDWYTCASAHSEPLNANQKAYAAWWLWARLAGWDGTAGDGSDASAPVETDPAVDPDPVETDPAVDPDPVETDPAVGPDPVETDPAVDPDPVETDPAVDPDPVDTDPAVDPDPVETDPAVDPDPVETDPAVDPDPVDADPAESEPPESDSESADTVSPGCNPFDPSAPGCGLSDPSSSGCGNLF